MIKFRLVTIITIIIIVTGFILSLLTNYASSEIPNFIKENQLLLWILIFVCILILIVANIIYNSFGQTAVKISNSLTQANKLGGDMSAIHRYDVFISYSHKDSDWVKNKLLVGLESRGFSVFIDFRDFSGGSFGIEEMQRGVLESKRVIVVLSPDYVQSDWTKFENVMAQTLDPGATNRKIIPILLKDCNIPLRIQILHYRESSIR